MSAATPTGAVEPAVDAPVDGRSTRWDQHREKRRAELVAATMRAIRRHGAGVGMDDIAAVAGTSKTVFYRHFEDRAGLYRAVAEQVDRSLIARMNPQPASVAGRRPSGRAILGTALDTYLRLVEEDPEIYRFIVAAPIVPVRERAQQDPALAATDVMSGRVADLLARALMASGRDPGQAHRWSRAVVGLVRSAGDDWLRAGASASGTSRTEMVADLTDLLWDGLKAAWPE